MAPAPPGGLVAPVAPVATALVLLLLLLLCSFHRSGRRFSTQGRRESPGLVRGVRMAQLGSTGAAVPAGMPSPSEQQVDGSVAHLAHPSVGDTKPHVPGWMPHSHSPSEPTPRTPEFLRHRQLPLIPGNAGASTADPTPDAEGRIYESIKYKPGTPRNPQSVPDGGDPSAAVPEEPGREQSPGPLYAWVCRVPRPRQPPRAPEPPGEGEEEEEAPPLPEKRFDVE